MTVLEKGDAETQIGNKIGNIIDYPILIQFIYRQVIGNDKQKQGSGHIHHDSKHDPEIG
jgi:hypothetical protein